MEQQFINHCTNGNLELAQALFKTNPYLDIHFCNEAFKGCCDNGHLHIAQWLYFIRPGLNTHIIFTNGHLNVAQWLVSVKTEIRVWSLICSLRQACNDGHFGMVKWLYNVYPCIFSEQFIINACENRHFHIVIWLLCVKPEMDISFASPLMQTEIHNSILLYCLHHKNIKKWNNNLLPIVQMAN